MADKKKKKNKQTVANNAPVKSTAQSAEALDSSSPEAVQPVQQNSAVSKSEAKADKKTVAKRTKKKGPNIFVRFGKKIKETFSELKKVTWPTFPTVVKQTGVVLAVVAIFLVLVFLADWLLAILFGLIVK